MVLAALTTAVSGCSRSEPSNSAAESTARSMTTYGDAEPGVSQVPLTYQATESTTLAPSRSDLTFENDRGYRFGVDAAVGPVAARTELADLGKLRLLASSSWSLSISNLLDDRPAPFEFDVPVGAPAPSLYAFVPISADLARQINEVKDPVEVDVYNIRDSPYVSVDSRGGFVQSYNLTSSSEIAPSGTLTIAATATARFGDIEGWPEAVITQLADAIARDPVFVVVLLDPTTSGAANCDNSTGVSLYPGFGLVLDLRSRTWSTPGSRRWDRCLPPEWSG